MSILRGRVYFGSMHIAVRGEVEDTLHGTRDLATMYLAQRTALAEEWNHGKFQFEVGISNFTLWKTMSNNVQYPPEDNSKLRAVRA